MPKSSGESGLEIADFIVNAAGSQARRQLRGISGFAQDFQAVFHRVPRQYGHFFIITEVDGNAENSEAVVRGLRPTEHDC